jgi:DNA-binding transcriptional LysR family regulator
MTSAPIDPSPTFSIRQLEHFVAVVEAGTISRAAEQLFMSPSAVSGSLSELERALATDLLIRRRGRGVTLTATGAHVLTKARALLSDAAELNYLSRSGTDSLTGPLAVGCFVTLAPTVLPTLLAEFTTRHPDVTVEFLEGSQTELQERLVDGELDLAVLYDRDLTVPLERSVLDSPSAYAVFGQQHPLANQTSVTLEELASWPLVVFDAPPSFSYVMSLFDARGLTPRLAYRTQSSELTRSIVARDPAMYALLVQRSRSTISYEGLPVLTSEIEPAVPPCEVVLAWPNHARLSPRARAFAQLAGAGHARIESTPG